LRLFTEAIFIVTIDASFVKLFAEFISKLRGNCL
jgi:hypothetical protein